MFPIILIAIVLIAVYMLYSKKNISVSTPSSYSSKSVVISSNISSSSESSSESSNNVSSESSSTNNYNVPISGPVYAPSSSTSPSSGPVPSTPAPLNEIYSPKSSPVFAPLSSPLFSPLSSPLFSPLSSPLFSPLSSPLVSPISSPLVSPISSPQQNKVKFDVPYITNNIINWINQQNYPSDYIQQQLKLSEMKTGIKYSNMYNLITDNLNDINKAIDTTPLTVEVIMGTVPPELNIDKTLSINDQFINILKIGYTKGYEHYSKIKSTVNVEPNSSPLFVEANINNSPMFSPRIAPKSSPVFSPKSINTLDVSYITNTLKTWYNQRKFSEDFNKMLVNLYTNAGKNSKYTTMSEIITNDYPKMINDEYGKLTDKQITENIKSTVKSPNQIIDLGNYLVNENQSVSNQILSFLEVLIDNMYINYVKQTKKIINAETKVSPAVSPKVAPAVSPKVSPKVSPAVSPKVSPAVALISLKVVNKSSSDVKISYSYLNRTYDITVPKNSTHTYNNIPSNAMLSILQNLYTKLSGFKTGDVLTIPAKNSYLLTLNDKLGQLITLPTSGGKPQQPYYQF